MMRASVAAVALALVQASGAAAQEGASAVSLRLDGNEIALSASLSARLSGLARESMRLCGPNTRHHPQNFGLAAILATERWQRALKGSRLHVIYDAPFETQSHLGGTLRVSEVTLGLEDKDLFVGPGFTRHAGRVVEHLQCQYLPALEIACLPELAPHLSPRYGETCARLERGADGRIAMPPPDIAPSCS